MDFHIQELEKLISALRIKRRESVEAFNVKPSDRELSKAEKYHRLVELFKQAIEDEKSCRPRSERIT